MSTNQSETDQRIQQIAKTANLALHRANSARDGVFGILGAIGGISLSTVLYSSMTEPEEKKPVTCVLSSEFSKTKTPGVYIAKTDKGHVRVERTPDGGCLVSLDSGPGH